MVKKVKTPLYDALKGAANAALLVSKAVTGPWGWMVKFIAPRLMDKYIRPVFVKWRERKNKKK